MLRNSNKSKQRAPARRSLGRTIKPVNAVVIRSAASLFVATLVNHLTPSSALAQTVPSAAACGAANVNWMAGAFRCSAPIPSLASGRAMLLQDTTAPTTGFATFSCINGAWAVQQGASCALRPSYFSEADPVGSAAKRLDAMVLSDSQPGFVGTEPLQGTTFIARPSVGPDGFATAEMTAVKKALNDELSNVGPGGVTRWWATSMSPQVTVMEPGQTVVVTVMKVDVNGVAYEPLRYRAGIELTTRWQRVDGTIVSGFGSARFVVDDKIEVTAPSNAGIGRMLVSVKSQECHDWCTPGPSRLSALFSGEVLAVKNHVINLAAAGQVQLPSTNGAISSTRFTPADLKAAMLAFRDSKIDRLNAIGYPVVISGAAPIAAGKVVDFRLQGIPMGGTVFSSVTRGAEQMLVVALDPAEPYIFAKYSPDAIYNAGLVAQNPVWTFDSDPRRGYIPGAPAASASRLRTLSPSAAPVAPEPPCGTSASRSLLSVLPVFNLYKGEVGLYVNAVLSGTGEVECKWSFGSDGIAAAIATVAGAITAGPVGLIAGGNIKPKPYGEIKLKGIFTLDSTQLVSYTVGIASGEKYGPKSELKLPPLGAGTALTRPQAEVKLEFGGEMGLKSSIPADATGGAIGLALQLTNLVTGFDAGDDEISVKGYVGLGVSGTLPNAPKVYADGGGAQLKLAAKGGAKSKLPDLLEKYLRSIAVDPGSLAIKFDATIAEAGIKMAFDATTKPRTRTSTQLTTLKAKGATSAESFLLAYDKVAKGEVPVRLVPSIGVAAPKRNLSFLGRTVEVGGTVSGTSEECQNETTSPFISGIGPLIGISNEVTVCSPTQKGQDIEVDNSIRVATGFDKNKDKILSFYGYGVPDYAYGGDFYYQILMTKEANSYGLLESDAGGRGPDSYIGGWRLIRNFGAEIIDSGGRINRRAVRRSPDVVDSIRVIPAAASPSFKLQNSNMSDQCQIVVTTMYGPEYIPDVYCKPRGYMPIIPPVNLRNVDVVEHNGSSYFKISSPYIRN